MNRHPPLKPELRLPHDLEAEAAVLGAMLLAVPGSELLANIFAIVGPHDFYRPAHVAIYNAIAELWAHGGTTELLSVKGYLEDRRELESAGGIDGLLALVECTPSGGQSGPYHAARVHDLARLRRLADAAYGIGQDIADNPSDAAAVIAKAEAAIFAIGAEHDRRGAVRIGADIANDLERLERGEILRPGLPTGFEGLDRLAPMTPAAMIVLAARPSMGKTALGAQIGLNWSLAGKPVLLFSLEMAGAEVRARILSGLSGIAGERLRSGEQFAGVALTKLREAGERLKAAPLFIDDTRGLSIDELRSRARRETARHGLAAIVVDYLQLLSAPGAENRTQEVSRISGQLKALAGELELPVIVLSQLNREAVGREDHRPRLSDLRDSGAIEQDADVVLMLHREDYYRKQSAQRDGLAEVIIAKNRNGRTGIVELIFDEPTTNFSTGSAP